MLIVTMMLNSTGEIFNKEDWVLIRDALKNFPGEIVSKIALVKREEGLFSVEIS